MSSSPDYDADLYRDGYKMGRGGKCNRMFKGNERTNKCNTPVRSRRKWHISDKQSRRRNKRSKVKKEANLDSAEISAVEVQKYRGAPKKDCTDAKECQICCEIRPLVSLLNKCNHAPICRKCLREIYVNQAQQNVSNYPLRCYHPSCRKEVHNIHFVKHDLIHSKKEFIKHYKLQILGKAYKGSRDVVYCPRCEFPKIVNNRQNRASCRQCKLTYEVVVDKHTSMQSTIDAIESMKGDKIGINDGWTSCPNPKCKLLISKGAGCDHMVCVCGKNFSWTETLKKKPSILRYAAVINKMETLPS